MNDLNTISRLNSEAAARELAKAPKGKYAVAEYAGLHFIKYHYADDFDAAVAIAAGINARGDSSRAKAPTEHPIAAEKDAVAEL